jgi:hypothetical protein
MLTALAGHLRLSRPLEGLWSLPILETHDTMPEEIPNDGSDSSRFRTTLIRVIIVQLVALGLLLWLQLRYQP